MIYTLFFSKMRDLSPSEIDEYHAGVAGLKELAKAEHRGFVSIKTYVADDGDRLTVARFQDEASRRTWMKVPAHQEAQRRARSHYYERFHIVVCQALRSHEFTHPEARSEG